jgi:hypothetical protein
MSFFNSFTLADSANLDAFSRLRVAESTSLFTVQNQYNTSSLKIESGNTGTGVLPAHNANTRMVALSATAGSGTSFIQSYNYFPYFPGKSQLIKLTGVLGTGVAGAVVDAGYFDLENGIFLRQNGASGLQVVRRSKTSGSVVDDVISQASWNLDKMDGTGASGVNLNEANAFILIIDLQFLGMGRVRIGFDVGGVIYYCHQFLNANVLTVPYMQTACLPIQMLLTATTTGGAKTSYFKCASVDSEGGTSLMSGYPFSTPSASVTAGNGTRTHILSIRPKTTYNSLTNRMQIDMDSFSLVVTGSNPVFFELVVGAAFTVAPTWADINTTHSGTEYGTGGTFSNLTNGVVIASGYVPSTAGTKGSTISQLLDLYPITLDRAGAQRAMGTLSLLVTGLGGTSATQASMSIIEVR